MEITTVYEDDFIRVKKVMNGEKLLYTRTYIFDDEGFVEKSIIVWNDGKVIETT